MSAYRWTRGAERLLDAVTVEVGIDALDIDAAGLSGEPALAMVRWPGAVFNGIKLEARSAGPFDVAVALDYAAEIAQLYGLKRVVVSLRDRSLWRREWGELREIEEFE